LKDWIAIFKTGTHTDSSGNTKTWTEQDLDRIAAYDSAKHEAPVVIGHPKDNAPAYGWAEALKRDGEFLYAKLKDLVPEFVDMVKKGMFKKRSISLYPDGTLRHIGFLGAMPPAIKGLPDVAFSDEGSITIDFSAAENRKEEHKMSFWERLKKKLADSGISFSDLFGSETPPVLYTEADIQGKVDAAVSTALKAKETEFSEKVASLDEQRRKKDEDLKSREEALKAKETEGKKAAIASFAEDLKKKGILTPAMEKLGMGVTAFMQTIAEVGTTVEFGEGDSKGSQSPLEFMQAFLSALPPQITFREVAGRQTDAGGAGGDAGEKLDALVKEKMKANPALTYGAAFAEVQNENKELAAEYAEEIG